MFFLSPCAVCPNGSHTGLVQYSGPDDASVLYVGEGPGYYEDRAKKPFIGKSGRELDSLYLRLSHTPRPQVKVANAVCCFFDGDNQTPDQARVCSDHNLRRLIQSMPHLTHVVLMGGVACSILEWAAVDAVTDDPVPVPNLLIEHGLPVNDGRPIKLFDRVLNAFAVIHPAAGLHQTSAVNDIYDDFSAIPRWRMGLPFPRDEYVGKEQYWELADDGRKMPFGPVVAFDTELDAKRRAWCAQVSTRPGMGLMARRGSLGLLHVQEVLNEADEILIHNAKFDYDVSAELGLYIDQSKVTDTMLVADNLSLPKGMKSLALRLLGMKMQSWEDITGSQFEQDCIEWLLSAEAIVKEQTDEMEAEVMAAITEMAEASVPPDVKNRRNVVNRVKKQMIADLEEVQADEWRPPAVRYVNKNGLSTRRRAPAYDKQIAVVLSQHQRSKDQGGSGTDFRKRWYGDENDDESLGLRDRLAVWAVQKIRQSLGEFPGMGLDKAPYEEALRYSCRDVDALIRLGPELRRIGRTRWVLS